MDSFGELQDFPPYSSDRNAAQVRNRELLLQVTGTEGMGESEKWTKYREYMNSIVDAMIRNIFNYCPILGAPPINKYFCYDQVDKYDSFRTDMEGDFLSRAWTAETLRDWLNI